MKYIRTKDGRIIKVGEGTDVGYDLGTLEVHNKAGVVTFYEPIEVLKIADTIEELCDEFVVKGVPNKTFVVDVRDYKPQGLTLKDYIGFLFAQYSNIEIYGAIWTEWGLKYVAKMNEKGELCLL